MFNKVFLFSYIHQYFDIRILLINLNIKRIRIFILYDIITEYYSKLTILSKKTDFQIL